MSRLAAFLALTAGHCFHHSAVSTTPLHSLPTRSGPPAWSQRWLSEPAPLASTRLQLIIKEPAMLIYAAFCWDSWVFYLLLCPRLHLSFTTARVLLIIGIFFFWVQQWFDNWSKDFLNSNVLCNKHTKPNMHAYSLSAGVGMQLFEQLPGNRDSQGNKAECLWARIGVNTYGGNTPLWLPVNMAAGLHLPIRLRLFCFFFFPFFLNQR